MDVEISQHEPDLDVGPDMDVGSDMTIKIPPDNEEVQPNDRDVSELYPGETPIVDEIETDDLTDIYNQFQHEDAPDDEFNKIVDHGFHQGVLTFTVRYQRPTEGEILVAIPFNTLKNDVPLECAKYIRNYVIDSTSRLSGTYTEWAKQILKQHTRAIRRLHRTHGTGILMRSIRNQRAKTNRTASKLAIDAVQGLPQRRRRKFVPRRNKGSRFLGASSSRR
jgi:hypothetical protein